MHEAERDHESGPPLLARYLPVWPATRAAGCRSATPTPLWPADACGPAAAPGAGDGPDGHVGDSGSTTSSARRRTSRSGPTGLRPPA